MNERLTTRELIAGLAMKTDVGQADAETFVRSFTTLIEDGVKRDKYVRIKGFGTFKLIDTDLNEGRVVFVPETSVRDAVNRPFAHFRSVELREGLHFGDIEELPVHSHKDTETADDGKHEDDATEEKHVTDDGTDRKPLGLVASEEETHDTAGEETPDKKPEVRTKGKPASWLAPVAMLLAGIAIGCGIVWGVLSHGVRSDGKFTDETAIPGCPDTVLTDTACAEDNYTPATDAQDMAASRKEAIDSIINAATEDRNEIEYLSGEILYRISGTVDTFTIADGSTLSKIAYRYYKNRKLWPYIVMHNRQVIQDPNNVPIGTVLRIPELTPAE